MYTVSPHSVLKQISHALPADCRDNMIIVGSLAAACHFFDGSEMLKTKDADGMLSPNAKAVSAAVTVTDRLLDAKWELRADDTWGTPGTHDIPTDKLPMVRLRPPGQTEWFLELLGAPKEKAEGRTFERLNTAHGDFALCCFGHLRLVECNPIQMEGIRIARPEMMALANLLHHPVIGTEPIKGGVAGRSIKRSNKDLGRVLALAFLTNGKNADELETWPQKWAGALNEKYGAAAQRVGARAHSGINALLKSPADLDEALHTCNMGLLASKNVNAAAFQATGQRFIGDVIEPFEHLIAI